MKKRIREQLSALVLALCMFLTIFTVMPVSAQSETASVDILFTHDMHSRLNSFETPGEDGAVNIGGFARIKTIIDMQTEKNPNTLVVDGGDFSMGTLFQTIYEQEATELRMLGMMGYDAAALGNHEFDYRTDGLVNMLNAAKASGDVLPQLLLCNVDWTEMNEAQGKLKEAFDNYGIMDYTVVDKGGVKIALIGVFGEDALACAPTCELKFEDPIHAVKETVAEIRENEDVDMIVCLSHGGTDEKAKKSEDENLAKAVPELDVIISGHTHTVLEEPIVHGSTVIVSAGEYGMNVGKLSLTKKEEGRWDVETYELIPTTESVASDETIQEAINSFAGSIDEQYLAQFGMQSDEVLCENPYVFATLDEISEVHTEHNLGDIMSDAYIYGVENAQGYDGEWIAAAVVPSGTIRDTYVPGEITVSDVFNSFSLGIGPDKIPGYPLIKVYLTGEELKTAAEIDASISDFMTTARLYCSGLQMTYNPNRLILNRVTDVYLTRGGEREEIEDDKLYCVVADLYSGQMLSAVTDMSYGLLSIVPKHADGTKVEDFEDCIIYDGEQELKAWAAIARYMQSFEKNADGTAVVPEYYNEFHDRKVVDDDKSLIARIKNPNKYAAMIAAVLLLLIVLVILLILLVVKIVKRIRKRIQKKKKV